MGWVDIVRRTAAWVTALAVLLTGFSIYYAAANLGINTDTGDMLSKEVPYQRGWEDFKRAFPQLVDTILVVVDGDSADLAEDSAAALARRIEAERALIRDVYRPEGDPFFHRNGLLYLDADELMTVTDRLADAQPLLSDLAEDPSLRGLFGVLAVAADEIAEGTEEAAGLEDVFDAIAFAFEAQRAGRPHKLSWQEVMMGQAIELDTRRRIMIVQPVDDDTELLPGARAIKRIRALTAELGLTEANGVRVRLTGSVPLSYEELQSAARGAATAAVVSVCLVTLLLFIGLRSPRLVIATLATLLMGLVWTAAFAAAVVGRLNLISLGFAVLFVGLGVDFGIHFGLRYKEAIQRGVGHAAALRDAAGGVGGALTLCAVAAAIGFFSFVGTEFIGLSELGKISGGSMFIALFANLTLMPAVLTLLPLKPERRRADPAPARVSGVSPTTPELLVRRHARSVVVGALLLGVAAALLAPKVRFDFDPLHLKDPNSESASTFVELQREERASTHSLSVLTGSLDEAVALAERLERLATVDGARTLADYVPEDQDEKLEMVDNMALFLAPVLNVASRRPAPAAGERRAALSAFRGALERLLSAAPSSPVLGAARRLAAAIDRFEAGGGATDTGLEELEDRLLATLPARLDRLRQSLNAERVKIGDLPERLRGREIATDGRHRVQIYPAEDVTENAALRRFVATVTEVAPAATGGPVVILGAGDAVARAMRQALLTAFAAISLLLLVVLRNLIAALLVLLPLLLASLLTLATAVLFNLPFNFANIIVLPLLLSLGVASGIHLVMRARGEAAGIMLSETSTPRAVVFSALTTIGSFGSLALSSHRGTASMGELLTIAIFFTLVCTLVVLPALMSVVPRRRWTGPAMGRLRRGT